MIACCPLASGSRGNSVYLGTKESKILIDAGISGKAIAKRLGEIDVDLGEIDAICVTHEHGDHIQGLKVLAKKLGIPILANSETAKGIYTYLKACPKFQIFQTGESFSFRDLQIHPFSIPHDCADPVAFTIEWQNYKAGFCTDLGFVTSLIRQKLENCDYLYLEANHERELVQNCKRPAIYKQRVLSRFGHLSNQESAQLLSQISNPKLKAVHLAHLSSECNTEELAKDAVFKQISEELNFELHIAEQDENSAAIFFEASLSSSKAS